MSLDNKPSFETHDQLTSNIEVGLDSLEQKFSQKYGLSLETLEKIKSFKLEKQTNNLQDITQNKLSNLKNSVDNLDISDDEKNIIRNLSNDQLDSFIHEIDSLKNSSAEKLSNLEKNLTGETIEEIASSNHKNDKLFTKKRIIQVCNPTKPHHHFDGIIVGATKSVVEISKTVWKICVDTVKLPWDIYKIATWKAYTNQFQDI